ncbi:MAG: SLC13 family permease [Planctomycetota bacterium]
MDNLTEVSQDGSGAPPWLSRRGIWIALIGFVASEILLQWTAMPAAARHCASITILTGLCWTLEAIPIGAASLIPLALFPLFGVLPATTAAFTYFDDINFLFLGGMAIGAALERWNLHRRVALGVVRAIGTGPRTIVLGFLLGTAVVSMWVSNTATAVMMYPIAVAILETGNIGKQNPGERAFATALLLSVAYGANIGGVGTPIGTGPNFAFFGQFNSGKSLASFEAPAFPIWIAGMLPLLLLTGFAGWLLLTRVVLRVPREIPRLTESFKESSQIGKWTVPEIRTAILFGIAIILWIARTLPFGGKEYGWLQFFPEQPFAGIDRENAITNSTIAIGIMIIAFLIPAGDKSNSKLLDASAIRKIPWDMLLLLGGGFAIAKGFSDSRLSAWLGDALAPAAGSGSGLLHAILVTTALSAFVTFLSEVTSNTATSLVMLPIAAELGRGAGIDPRLLALSVTMAASLAFMLPIGTPPNAIVFASGRIKMLDMIRAGFLLNMVAIVLSTALLFIWIAPIFNIPVTMDPK